MTRYSVLAFIIAMGCQSTQHPLPREQEVQFVLRQDLDAAIAANREVVVQRAWVPPNATVSRHWHPSETFHYYLQGEATIRLDHGEALKRRAGEVSHIPSNSIHSVRAGPSGVTILIFRIHLKGKPIRYDARVHSSHP